MQNCKKVWMATAGALFTVLGTAEAGQGVTTFGNPADYLVPPGGFSGVASLRIEKNSGEQDYCTGSLLPGGSHILTAAHCLTDESGVFNTTNAKARFLGLATGKFKTSVTDYYINRRWTGDVLVGNDIAVLKLAQPAPPEVSQYSIYRGTDEVGKVFDVVGYGEAGDGNIGRNSVFALLKRSGKNKFDALGDILIASNPDAGITPGSQLIFDFDNGKAANDFFGTYFGLKGKGLGLQEAIPSFGDSGGPGFINGQIAGVTSYGVGCDLGYYGPPCLTDIDSEPNDSFGEFTGMTRVSYYSNFIDRAVAGLVPSPTLKTTQLNSSLALDNTAASRLSYSTSVPESSSTVGLVTFGALGTGLVLKRKQKLKAKANIVNMDGKT